MEIVENVALITINETLFVQLISFLVFMFIMNRIMFRPLRTLIEDRDAHFDRLRTEIVKAEQRFDELTHKLKRQEEHARHEGHAIRMDLENSGNQEAYNIHETTVAEVHRLRDETARSVELQLAEARGSLAGEAEKLAVAVMERVLNRRLA